MAKDDFRKDWEDERRRADEAFRLFKENLEKAKQARAQNDPVYQPEDILFSVGTGTFQHDFKYKDLAEVSNIMAHAKYGDFDAAHNAFVKWAGTFKAKLDAKEPKKSQFFAQKNFTKAHNDWESENKTADKFETDFNITLEAFKQQKIAADPKYQWVDLAWHSTALGLTISETDTIHQKDLTQCGETALEEALVNEIPDFHGQILNAIAAQPVNQDAFFLPQNYQDANAKWKENIDRLNKFVTRIKNAIRAARRTLKKQQSPQPTTIVDVPSGFPNDPDSLKVVKRLGGSTGAELVEAPDGTRYVRKRGNNEGHVRSECFADAFYRAAGADVPEFRLYDTPNGPVKLSRYYEGTQALNDWWKKASKKEKAAMTAELRKQYATDVLLGNWDVVGASADNILIDKDGKPWRIDNGGALAYRAQGAKKKDEDWNDGFVDDLWTMTGNGKRIGNNAPSNLPTYFGTVDVGEIAKEINARDWTAALDRLPVDQRAIVQKRLEEVRQLAVREEDFSTNGFTREFTLAILDETYKFSKKGLREACSFTCDLEHGDYGWFRSNSSTSKKGSAKETAMQQDLLMGVKTINKHNKPGGDKKPTYSWIQKALDWKSDLQDALNQGYTNAQYYLDILQQIEDAYANQTSLPQIDVNKPVWSAGNQGATQNAAQGLQTQYSSLSQYLRAEMGDDAVNFIEDCNASQAGDSYADDACKTKILRLRAQGYDFNKYKTFDALYKDATQAGYYLGIPNGPNTPKRQYNAIKNAFNYFKANRKEYDKRYGEMTRYNAAIQIALENTNFTGNDRGTRSLVLDRTEEDVVVFPNRITLKPGDKCVHKVGVNESHSAYKTFCFRGHHLTMVRVPYSRINGLYMMERGVYDATSTNIHGMFAGPDENEIVADTHGLTVYFMEANISSGRSLAQYIPQFKQYETNNP